MQEKQIVVNNLKTNYKIAGQGPVVLILHGWGASSDSWVEIQQILAEKGYQVIVPDFSGFGKSIAPLNPWGVKDYSNFILEFIEKLSVEKVILIGHSFGGRISIKLASLYPEKIEKLILCNSAGIKPKPGIKISIAFIIAKVVNALLSPKYFTRFKEPIRKNFYRVLRRKDYFKAKGIMKEVMKRVLAEDLEPELSKIKVKSLIIQGGKDKIVPPEHAEIFNKKIIGSKIKMIPEVGHSPHLEIPKKLAEIILKFISQ